MGRKKKYFTEEERKAARRGYDKKWRKANKEHIKEYNKEYLKEWRKANEDYMKEWRKANKERIKAYKETPMGRAANLVGGYKRSDKEMDRGDCTLTKEWIVDNIFTSKCRYCGETDWTELGCDRIDNDKPHTPDNVVCSCEDCNKKRHRKPFEVFLKEMQQKMLEEFENPL